MVDVAYEFPVPHLKDRGIGKTIANRVELVGRDIEMVAEQFDLALGIFPVVALREPNGLRTIDQSVPQIACRIVLARERICSTSGNREDASSNNQIPQNRCRSVRGAARRRQPCCSIISSCFGTSHLK